MFADWKLWRPMYDQLTLLTDGSPEEIALAREYDFDAQLPNLVRFWRLHVCPATNRPANIDHRPEVSQEFWMIAKINHDLLTEVGRAAGTLRKVNAGDFGGITFDTVRDFILQAGNAVTKFRSIQDAVSGLVSNHGGVGKFELFTKTEFKATWQDRRDRVMYYRNAMTHSIPPYIFPDPDHPLGERFLMLHHREVDLNRKPPELNPTEAAELFATTRAKFAPVAVVCNDLYADSLRWLDNIYSATADRLEPFLSQDWHLNLQGWDTISKGRHVNRAKPPQPIYQDVYGRLYRVN